MISARRSKSVILSGGGMHSFDGDFAEWGGVVLAGPARRSDL